MKLRNSLRLVPCLLTLLTLLTAFPNHLLLAQNNLRHRYLPATGQPWQVSSANLQSTDLGAAVAPMTSWKLPVAIEDIFCNRGASDVKGLLENLYSMEASHADDFVVPVYPEPQVNKTYVPAFVEQETFACRRPPSYRVFYIRMQSPDTSIRVLPAELETMPGSPLFDNESWQLPDFQFAESVQQFGQDCWSDARHFYSWDNVPLAATFLGSAAMMANTSLDQDLLNTIQRNITFHRSDEYQEFVGEFKFMGEGYSLLPLYAATAILGQHVWGHHPVANHVGQWGERTFRAVLVGTPPLLISQKILGASRPGESPEGSEWQFFADDNAVSGHAFMGAVPFLTAANMSETMAGKCFWFTCSTLPALSRVSENAHYPSQALLGWSLAYLACRSVNQTEDAMHHPYHWHPILTGDGAGLGLTIIR